MPSAGQTMLERTRSCVEENRNLLKATRHWIARSRRVLNPFFRLAGGAAPPRRETVRALLAGGKLPPASGKVLVGYGTGTRCVVCHAPVPSTEVEYGLDTRTNGTVVCHVPCFLVWREESAPATRGLAGDGPGLTFEARS
jgi:hypothetical protein